MTYSDQDPIESSVGAGGISPGAFLNGAAAGAAPGSGVEHAGSAEAAHSAPGSTADRAGSGLTYSGVSYDVGTDYGTGNSRKYWTSRLMENDIKAIREQLKCNSVNLYGTRVDRLLESAEFARSQGLYVWIQPRTFDQSQEDIVGLVGEAAAGAESLRAMPGDVALNVGAELTIFAEGIIPGDTFFDRLTTLQTTPRPWPVEWTERLNAFLAELRRAARASFAGPLTYGAGSFETVDWADFDVLGLNYYRSAANAATFLNRLRSFYTWGKPIAITEFGCCAYDGADDLGPNGFLIDFDNPPVRDEEVQAQYVTELLNIFEGERLHAAMVFDFIQAEYPHHRTDPHRDMDLASLGVVKVLRDDHEDAASPYTWEKKLAFLAIAAHNIAAGR